MFSLKITIEKIKNAIQIKKTIILISTWPIINVAIRVDNAMKIVKYCK